MSVTIFKAVDFEISRNMSDKSNNGFYFIPNFIYISKASVCLITSKIHKIFSKFCISLMTLKRLENGSSRVCHLRTLFELRLITQKMKSCQSSKSMNKAIPYLLSCLGS